MADLITISSSAFGDSPHVVAFRAREALGSTYEVEIFLTMPIGDELDVAEAAGARATLTLDRGFSLPVPSAEKPMHWSGVLLEVSIIAEVGQRSLVRALLVPRLFRAAQNFHSRIFTDKNLVTILKDVLDKNGVRDGDGFDASGLNAGNYPKEEHIAQWVESDLDFLHRWFEREGIFYHFEQTEEAEKVMLVDKNPSGDPLHARFHALLGEDVSAGPCVTRFRCDGRSLVGVVKVVDRDYAQPSLALSKEDDVSELPGEYVLPHSRLMRSGDVDRISKIRKESMKARAKTYRAEATLLGLRPGVTFHLDEHPRAAFANDYLVTEADHIGWNEMPGGDMRQLIELDAPQGPSGLYHVRLSAMEAATPFRLQKRTAWPRVDGYETATIDGPVASDYAQIDDMGRYLVRYHADESMGEDAKVSTWIRMMQPHTGAPEGMHFPLRKGTEVLIAFLGGDPDRPVILGAVPNAVTPSVVTKKNHTQNRLFTGGGTTLEIEDQAGSQYVHWYTPVDHTHFHMGAPRKMQGEAAPPHETKASLGWSTDGNAVLSVGKEWDVGVGGKLHEIVQGDVVEEYKKSRTETVTGPTVETYDGKHDLTVTGKQTVKIDTGKEDTIKTGWKQKIAGGWTQDEIFGSWDQKSITGGWKQPSIAGGWTQTILDAGWTQTMTGDLKQTVTGNEIHKISGSQTLNVGADGATYTITGPWVQNAPGGITINTPKFNIVGAKKDEVEADLFEAKGTAMGSVVFEFALKGIEINVKGLAVGLTSIEMSGKILELEKIGLSLSIKDIEVGCATAAKFETGGFWAGMKGLWVKA